MKFTTLDPIKWGKLFWPETYFYDKQEQVIRSVCENDETFVPAANMMGKDFVAAFIVLYFFLTRSPCRIITTSAKADHLMVLWGEINRFIQTSRIPLECRKGGPLIIDHQKLRKLRNDRTRCPISYVKGLVAAEDSIAAMGGHHVSNIGDGIPRTLLVADESSSVPDAYIRVARGWYNRLLSIGNTWPCNNFFKNAIEGKPGAEPTDFGGDRPRPVKEGEELGFRGYYRKVIHIAAEDSPNIRYAFGQIAKGLEHTDEILVPGVKSYGEYLKNLDMWDAEEICVRLHAKFYKGPSLLLFPETWLQRANDLAEQRQSSPKRGQRWMGCDPGEGVANSAWAIIDETGLLELISKKTPNTTEIVGTTIGLIRDFGIDPEDVIFDRGGGGKQHADRLRDMGYAIRTVAFGEAVTIGFKYGSTMPWEKTEHAEERYAYKNRRAQLYGELSLLMDPNSSEAKGFAIPSSHYKVLRDQLKLIPRWYDGEGRLRLPSKNKSTTGSKEQTLIEIIGHSPDEADALTLAVHGMLHKPLIQMAGAIT